MTVRERPQRKQQQKLSWQYWLGLVTIYGVLLAVRVWGGLNYAGVNVLSPDSDDVLRDIRVYAWMPQRGFLRELDRLEEVPQVWMMQWKIESCQSILAVGTEQSAGVLSRFRVTTGDSWVGPAKVLSTSGALQDCRDPALLKALSGGGSRRVVELPVRRGASLFGLPGSINWQGDGLLVLVPLMQMFVVILVLRFVCRLLRSVAAVVRANTLSAGCFSASVISETIRLVVLIALFHQFGTTVTRILTIRNGIESLFASVAGCVLLWAVQNPSRMVPRLFILRWRLALVVLFAVILLVKLCWILRVSSFQSTDYGRYLSIGELLCDGRWDVIAARAEPLLRTYVRRATVVTVPAVWCFGRGVAAIEAWNFLLQSGTLALFWMLVKLLTNSRATGAVAVVLLWLMPEFWYTATIASHNVSANFLLCSSLLLLLLFLLLFVIVCVDVAASAAETPILFFL